MKVGPDMNVDPETIVNEFVAAIGELHPAADETPGPLTAKGRSELWPRIATWSLVSIALLAVWILGILSLNWLGASR